MTGLYGLVLAGGKSSRMGRDKGSLNYHGVSQREYGYRLLSKFCEAVFVSCRRSQAEHIEPHLNTLFDKVENLGPAGGILTALEYKPDVAWLVVACDLPFLDEALIAHLVSQRDPEKVATAYQNPDDHLPEPLIAIWEPKSYSGLLEMVSKGQNCPRKFLLSHPCKLILPESKESLANINTPDEYEQARARLSKTA